MTEKNKKDKDNQIHNVYKIDGNWKYNMREQNYSRICTVYKSMQEEIFIPK